MVDGRVRSGKASAEKMTAEQRKERAMKRGGYDETEFERRYLADLTDFSEDKRIGLVDREIKNWDRELDDVVKEIVNE